MLDHGDGWRTIHCHLSDFTVSEGEDVERGEKIAEMGTTGVSTGPHLHWSIDQNGERKRIPFTEDYDVLRGAGVPYDYGL
jgi:murein DD-endopeptidase MepM/ murein hydrolase activator NlpD